MIRTAGREHRNTAAYGLARSEPSAFQPAAARSLTLSQKQWKETGGCTKITA